MSSIRYRTSPYWKAAIDLGPSLARLADELPASEENGLSLSMRQLSVELPATIAADLVAGTTTTRHITVLKLVAALELVDRVFPALDTVSARAAADALAEQLLAPEFGAPAEAPIPTAPSVLVPVSAAETPVLDTPAPAAPRPTLQATATELAAALGNAGAGAEVVTAAPAPVGTSVPVSSGIAMQENHVLADSVQ
jgi:hypothetical protein